MARTSFRQFRPKLVSLAVASCFATGAALANPTNPQVVHGAANFANPAANVLNITTATPQTIINWGGFSIAVGELTKFLQPSAASAVLNRVIGSGGAIDPSVILGALQSNGRVFLVNPSGILFGAGAQIDVAGLVATSMNLSNADFLANRLKFTEVPGAGSVINQGNITTGQGGQVYLVGPAVANNGIITSPNGEVVLAAGNTVELVNPGTPNLRVEITAAENEAKNLGSIIVDSGRAGIYAGLVNNSGTVRADSVVSEGGRIMLKAAKNVTLEDTSVLSAQGVGGGRIEVLADNNAYIAGTLDVSAPNGGDGGFIETSAKNRVSFGPHFITGAAPHGKSGHWLIDPTDFYIGSAGDGCPGDVCDISGAQLGTNLAGLDITILSDAGANDPGTNGGNIFVLDPVSWSSAKNLTLTARRNVEIFNGITNTGTGSLFVNSGWDGSSTTGAGDILVNSSINVGGAVNFQSGQDIKINFSSVDAGGNITFGAGRDIVLNAGRVWAGAGSVFGTRDLIFTAGRNIELNAPDGGSSVESTSSTSDNANLRFTAGSAISITGSNVYSSVDGGEGGDARVTLNAGTKVTIDGSKVEASGGLHTFSGQEGGTATVTIVGPTGIDILNGSTVAAYAGNGDIDFRNESSARVELCGAMGEGCESGGSGKITVNNSKVYARGGDGAEGSMGKISLLAGSGGIGIIGSKSGNGLLAYGGYAHGGPSLDSGDIGVGGEGVITLQAAGGSITVDGSDVRAYGGGAGAVASGDGGNAAVTIFGANADITGGSLIKAQGGASAIAAGFGGDGSIGFDVAGMTVSGSELRATAGTGTTQSGSASIALNAALVDLASGSNVNSNAATNGASVQIDSVGNIKLGGSVSTSGAGAGGITLDSGGQIVGAGGTLYNSGSGHTISLTAANGIGTVAAPVRISNSNFGLVSANNTGGTGDVALSFFTGLGPVNISGASNIFNANPTGKYLVQAEGAEGGINLSAAFQPGGLNPGAGQSVHFRAPLSQVNLTGTGSISGAGHLTLEGQTFVSLAAGTSISATDVLLKSDRMDIQGAVTAGNNIFVTTFTAGRPIELGTVGEPSTVLALSASELTKFTALGLGIGTDGAVANTGAITFTGPVGPFSAFPNLFGSSITQPSGAGISAAGLNAFATGAITLTAPTNNIGSFGGTAGTSISLVTTGDLSLGAVTAGSSVMFQSLGGAILNTSGLANITSPTVSLSAATGIGSVLPIMLTNASPSGVTAINSTSGGIGLLQPNGTFTLGSGGWNVQNAPGGEIIIEGMNITLGAGAPNSGPLEIFASNEAIVGPAGYASANPVFLSGLNHVNVNGDLSASNLALFAGESVNINGAAVTATGLAAVAATKLNITAGTTAASLTAGDLVVIVGEINLQGGTGTNAFAEIKAGPGQAPLFITTFASGGTTGDINLNGGSGNGAYARIYGDPDVGSLLLPVLVGGVVNMNHGTGTGSYARIESASVNSIFVDFLNLTSGGFFVNGVENAVSSGGSGFFAGGQPAVLGQNLLVSYGGVGSLGGGLSASELAGVEQAINQVIVATNNTQSDLIGGDPTNNEGGVTDPKEEKDKKGLPVCGK